MLRGIRAKHVKPGWKHGDIGVFSYTAGGFTNRNGQAQLGVPQRKALWEFGWKVKK